MTAPSAGAPGAKPSRPWFSSGPCAKKPGWDPSELKGAFVGRSFRHEDGRERLREVVRKSADILGLPSDYRVGIVPASDTGAIEMAMWNLLGPRGVAVCCWENFGFTWLGDVVGQLRLTDVEVHGTRTYGALPDLARVDFDRDVVFTWNGTTSGVCVPDAEWIPEERGGLTICDATSAVFGMEVDFTKLDVATWSWQKALGGEGAHGMIALSPAAVERLVHYRPPWPLPKIFRLAHGGRLLEGVFDGFPVNSPSMLVVEDARVALDWCADAGGLPAMVARSRANLEEIERWVRARPYVEFLAEAPETRSSTSICLKFVDEAFDALSAGRKEEFVRRVCARIEEEGAGYDLASHREAPPGIRIWGGPTVDRRDIARLLPWVDRAFAQVRADLC